MSNDVRTLRSDRIPRSNNRPRKQRWSIAKCVGRGGAGRRKCEHVSRRSGLAPLHLALKPGEEFREKRSFLGSRADRRVTCEWSRPADAAAIKWIESDACPSGGTPDDHYVRYPPKLTRAPMF